MILPGMGVVSEIITCYTRRPVFGYRFMAGAVMAIAVLSFLVIARVQYAEPRAFLDLSLRRVGGIASTRRTKQ